ncbi:MAG TPA: hypothetical protein V6C57_24210 [Coleofasciculaceae cyanobacterium]
MMTKASASLFKYVEEQEDPFFELFPHRFDYIYAEHPEPAQSPNWQTESRHPLTNRIFYQGQYLFGVRFSSQTRYCLLDIDRGSVYHPQRDAFAISRILAALEPIGLTAYLACTSSYSGGLHLYFPFQEFQNSWEFATVVAAQLNNAGFNVKPGQLEIFPNPKPYAIEGHPSLFNAHRLPMQAGSYLLDQDFQPIWSDQQRFVAQWQLVQQQNWVDRKTIKRFLKQARRTQFRVSGKADKFVSDLNAEVEQGWTGPGQTNRLLGRIAMRAYIFHHVIAGGVPLEGQALVDEIVRTAQSLPGYQDWCNHQHEIEQRAEEWARCVQDSHYFHYGSLKGKYKAKEPDVEVAIATLPTWNQQQSESARERIRRAIADLLNQGSLPVGATARFQALTQYGIGGGSLYRHRDLWHPQYLVENPPLPPAANTTESFACAEGASNVHSLTSLLSTAGGNASRGQQLSDRPATISPSTGSNASSHTDRNRILSSLPEGFTGGAELPESDQGYLGHGCLSQSGLSQSGLSQADRMQQFLASGDPILVAEALSWTEVSRTRSLVQFSIQNDAFIELTSVDLDSVDLQRGMLPTQPLLADQDEAWLVFDLSDTLAAISVQIRRLGWSRSQVQDDLLQRFGKGDRSLLLPEELIEWLAGLEQHQPMR